MTLRVRSLSDEEREGLERMARSRTRGAGLVRRARIVLHALEGLKAPEIGARMELCGATVRHWLKRFNADGLGGSATYFALAARLFAPVQVIATVGSDFADAFWAAVSGEGVDLRGVARSKLPFLPGCPHTDRRAKGGRGRPLSQVLPRTGR